MAMMLGLHFRVMIMFDILSVAATVVMARYHQPHTGCSSTPHVESSCAELSEGMVYVDTTTTDPRLGGGGKLHNQLLKRVRQFCFLVYNTVLSVLHADFLRGRFGVFAAKTDMLHALSFHACVYIVGAWFCS